MGIASPRGSLAPVILAASITGGIFLLGTGFVPASIPGLPTAGGEVAASPTGEQPSRRLRILLTANTLGYIDPCDCGTTRMGGLDRRAAAIEAQREPGWAVLLFDLGNLLEIPGGGPPTQLGRLQAGFLVEEMARMGYDLVAVGGRDLRGEPAFVGEALRGLKAPLLLTNRAPEADFGFPTVAVKRFEIAGIVLEVFSVIEPALAGGHVGVRPWQPALSRALEASAEDPDPADVRVVIAHLPAGALEGQLADLEGVDLVLDGVLMAPRQAIRTRSGVITMSFDSRGQQLGRLDLEVVPRASPLRGNRAGIVGFQGRHIPLRLALPGDQEVRRRIDAFRSRLIGRGLIPPLEPR